MHKRSTYKLFLLFAFLLLSVIVSVCLVKYKYQKDTGSDIHGVQNHVTQDEEIMLTENDTEAQLSIDSELPEIEVFSNDSGNSGHPDSSAADEVVSGPADEISETGSEDQETQSEDDTVFTEPGEIVLPED